MTRQIESIDHLAFVDLPEGTHACGLRGVGLVEAARTDRERIGILLQGAAVLSHLERSCWRWQNENWNALWLDGAGILRGVVASSLDGSVPPPAHAALRHLLRRLFRTEGGVSGRGAGRVAARHVLALWNQDLRAIPADEAIGQLFSAADFLWEPARASARDALFADVRAIDGVRQRWVAGPGWVRRRMRVHRDRDRDRDRDRVEAPAMIRERESGWSREGVPAGGWSRSARRWLKSPPQLDEDRSEAARVLAAVGRVGVASRWLAQVDTPEARARRIVCAYHLGEFGASESRLRTLRLVELPLGLQVELGDVALRVYANRGKAERGLEWLRREFDSIDSRPSRSRVRGADSRLVYRLLRAASAWDLEQHDEMADWLMRSAEAKTFPRLAWRWYQLEGLMYGAYGDREAACWSLRNALTLARRALRPLDAAALWNDLVLARAGLGDLAGAERACRHGLRILRDSECARLETLFLSNLAELRLRRGSVEGVEEIIERVTQANQRGGNRRGGAHDVCLAARFELLRGHPEAALDRLRQHRRSGSSWNLAEARVLEARALGWLNRGEEASELLAGSADPADVLDQEELPALYALAGDREKAVRAASGPAGPLWRAVCSGGGARASEWSGVSELPPHRASRVVYDVARIAPDCIPSARLMRAAEVLRRLGAAEFAQRLEHRVGGLWRAIEEYFESNGDVPNRSKRAGASSGDESVRDLFRAAGCGAEVRVVVEEHGAERVMVDGCGGGAVVSALAASGRVLISAESVGSRERALLGLMQRTIEVARGRRGVGGGAAVVRQGHEIVGESPAVRRAIERADRLANTELPVLIQGETGTGKELLARRVHEASHRRREPFLPVNCAALSKTLLLSELFGHVRGAFTGAERDRPGVFEAAREGTVFLDEIGDLPAEAQGALLRVLQEREVRRLGENRPRGVAARIVSATHRNLEVGVSSGDFRSDLYFRLRAGQIGLPPLRDRGDDVLLLAARFLEGRGVALSDDAETSLLTHAWPGNVRELRNVLEAAAALLEEGERTIQVENLDLPERATPHGTSSYHQQVELFRKRLVQEALDRCGGHRSRAAKELGLSRQAMSYLVRTLGVSV